MKGEGFRFGLALVLGFSGVFLLKVPADNSLAIQKFAATPLAYIQFGPADLLTPAPPRPRVIKGQLFVSANPEASGFRGLPKTGETIIPPWSSTVRAGEFAFEIYQVARRPNTHLHVRPVDHNNVGFGGGLKIALEIVEEF